MEILSTADLHFQGLNHHDIARLVKRGDLVRLARGHYCRGEPDSRDEKHLALAMHWDEDVLAFESAALVHGLPVDHVPGQVHVIRPGDGSTWRRTGRALSSGPLPPAHVTEVAGRLVTTPARTAVDVARRRGVLPGLLVWEAARWRARVDDTLAEFDREVDDCLHLLKGRKGIDRARQARAIVMRHEKRRQESMEAEGWTFARWGKEEVRQPWRLKHVVEKGFALAAGRQLPRQVNDLLESTRGAPDALSTR